MDDTICAMKVKTGMTDPLLKAEPAGTLHSPEELFALAHAMEQEAATRYSSLADEMRRQDKVALAVVFEHLAAEERSHVDSVVQWSESRLGTPPDPALISWEGPETFDTKTVSEITNSALMTPYRALSMAVRNEERAFAFWSYVAAHADPGEIQRAAETMARQELEHVAKLRKERRRAYHKEKKRGRRPSSDAGTLDAGALEAKLAEYLEKLAAGLEGGPANRAAELTEETRRMSAEASGFGRFPIEELHLDPQAIAELLVEAYLKGADITRKPRELHWLQDLAQRSISRLAWLRALA
jgi:rubrerythrin